MNALRINKECSSYPCHKDLEDCTFCYCPFYPCMNKENGGKMLTVYQGTTKCKIWDCSECNLVHKKEFVDKAYEIIKENMTNVKTKDEQTNDI